MNRTLEPLKLSKSPLTLVVCQVRFSAVLAMEEYIARIQDRLRKAGYPLNRSGVALAVNMTTAGITHERHLHWEVRSRDETSSIIVSQDSVTFQTTAYETFEPFCDQVRLAIGTVAGIVGDLVIERLGLRYVDALVSLNEEDWRRWVRPGLHGVAETELLANPVQLHQTVATTSAGTLALRMLQNRDGVVVPPDLAGNAPKLQKKAEKGQLVTLLDMDHFWEGQFDHQAEKLTEKTWQLHDVLDQVFRNHVVTEEALRAWK